MTVRELLTRGYRSLFYAEVDTPFLDAVVLLAFAQGVSKEKVLASLPDHVDEESERRYLAFLSERAGGKPVSYIRRSKEFFGLEFYVDERVLVPRPDTETLVEKVLGLCRSDPGIRNVHDACTGSGCVAIALKRMNPELRMSASDISPPAQEVFAINARSLGVEIPFFLSDLLMNVPSSFDLISANPPYLSDGEVDAMAKVGWPEPEVSLRGGRDGTDVIARLIRAASPKLRAGGWLVVEAAPDQFLKLFALMDQSGFRHIEVEKDLAGRERVISGMRETAAVAVEGSQAHG
jgi:release factor glutamine methyltransferase